MLAPQQRLRLRGQGKGGASAVCRHEVAFSSSKKVSGNPLPCSSLAGSETRTTRREESREAQNQRQIPSQTFQLRSLWQACGVSGRAVVSRCRYSVVQILRLATAWCTRCAFYHVICSVLCLRLGFVFMFRLSPFFGRSFSEAPFPL